jgi:hypothetical protein
MPYVLPTPGQQPPGPLLNAHSGSQYPPFGQQLPQGLPPQGQPPTASQGLQYPMFGQPASVAPTLLYSPPAHMSGGSLNGIPAQQQSLSKAFAGALTPVLTATHRSDPHHGHYPYSSRT